MMDALHILFIFISLTVWVAAVVITALAIPVTLRSRFELKRLTELGDATAMRDELRVMVYGRLQSIKLLAMSSLMIIFTLLTLYTYGALWGAVVSLIAVPLMYICVRTSTVRRASLRLYQRYEDRLDHFAYQNGWLDWFGDMYPGSELPSELSRAEFEEMVIRNHLALTVDEQTRVLAGLHFGNKTVADVMTPKSLIETAHADDIIGPLVLDELHKTGHSRFPVIAGDIDHVIGMLYIHDLVELPRKKQTIRQTMHATVQYIRQDQSLDHALHGFLRSHRHLFIVVNEYRETVGVVSLEDVLESVIGKRIVDEFDRFDDLRAVAEHNPRHNNMPQGKKDI